MPTVRTGDFECYYAEDWFGPPWREPEVLLIQHGFGRNGEYWRHWVPDLARAQRVIRRDMRAHGGSTAGAADHVWSPEGLAADVVAFLDALALERVHFVGESVGGITGIVLGARYPERLHTLTLVQSPIRLGQRLQDAMRGEYPDWASALRELGPGGWIARNMPGDSPDPEVRARVAWERAQWDRCDAPALIRLSEATRHVDVAAYVPQVKVPTLVLAPACSPLTPLEDQLLLRTAIPDAELELFEGRGHNLYIDEPARCTARILQFIEGVRSRRR
jgi:pimeloyl-ACP methyl ester carboxylesterase